jgi:hypothetical protein
MSSAVTRSSSQARWKLEEDEGGGGLAIDLLGREDLDRFLPSVEKN